MARIFVSDDLSMYECPISGEIMVLPVIADDGHNYEREWIEKYFEAREQSGLPILSVWTGLPMSRELKPNHKLRSEIEQSMHRLKDPVVSAKLLSTENTSLDCLNAAFKELDQLRDVLAETLQGWKPPQLVIIGAESTGKSSLLERLIMMPVVPTAENVCTRLPVHIRLRNSSEAQAPRLEVFNTKSNQTEEGPYFISYQSGARAVADKMDELIKQEHGRLDSISVDRIIILHVQGPNVPTLDLVDMPGLRTTPTEMREGTRMLLQEHIRTNDSEKCMMYLAVVSAPCGRPNTSLSMELVQAMGLESRTIGVLTKCDLVSSRPGEMDKVRRLLQHRPNEALGSVELAPHGWFATMNAPPDSVEGRGNLARLRYQAEAEASFFAQHMPAEVMAGRATCNALIKTVCTVYQENLRTTWALETMRKLEAALRQARLANSALGQPQTVGPRDSEEALAWARNKALAVARLKCKGYGGAADSHECFQRVMVPLVEGLLAVASGSRDFKAVPDSGASPRSSKITIGSPEAVAVGLKGKAAAAKEECRKAVLVWGEYWLERCVTLLEQDESEEDEDSLLLNPPFQLGRFPSFISRVKGHLRAALEADQVGIRKEIDPLLDEFFDFKSPFVKCVMDVAEGFGQTFQNTMPQINQDALRPFLVDKVIYMFSLFTSDIPATNMVSEVVEKAANETALDEWVEACGEERAAILIRIDRAEKARRGIVQALSLSDLQVQKMEEKIRMEAREKTESEIKAKKMAEAEARRKADAELRGKLDKEKRDEENRKAIEVKVLAKAKVMADVEEKMKSEADERTKSEKRRLEEEEQKILESRIDAKIQEEFAKVVEKLRNDAEIRFKNMAKALVDMKTQLGTTGEMTKTSSKLSKGGKVFLATAWNLKMVDVLISTMFKFMALSFFIVQLLYFYRVVDIFGGN